MSSEDSSDSSNDDDNVNDDDDDDDDDDDNENDQAAPQIPVLAPATPQETSGVALSSSSASSASSASNAAPRAHQNEITLNTFLFGSDEAFVWKHPMTPADYNALEKLLIDSVLQSAQRCHVQDGRSVENIARHVAWTQVWEINQARRHDYNLPEMDTLQTDPIIRRVVGECVRLTLTHPGCVTFDRFSVDADIFAAAYQALDSVFRQESASAAGVSLQNVVKHAVQVMQSQAFVDLVCNKMFSAAPRYQACEQVTRTMFAEWKSTRKAPVPIAGFVANLIDKISHFYLKKLVIQYIGQ